MIVWLVERKRLLEDLQAITNYFWEYNYFEVYILVKMINQFDTV